MKYAKILRHLADLQGLDRSFLTIYLDHPIDRHWLEHELNTLHNVLDHSADEYQHFQENRRMAVNFLESTGKRSHGLCLVCCWALDLREVYELPRNVGNLLWLDSSPYIRPLAEVSEEYQNVALVVADNNLARIYLVSAEIKQMGKIAGHIKNHVRVGGWSQQRYERRRDKALKHYGRDIVNALVRLKGESAYERLLLAGSQEAIQTVKHELPQQLVHMLVGEKALDLRHADLSEEIYPLVHAAERQAEMALWHAIKQQYMRHGLAAMGVASVLHAAVDGRVEKLLIQRDAEIKGLRCKECGQLLAGAAAVCSACGKSNLLAVDMVNELSEVVISHGGTVDYCPAFGALQAVGHVAALLRY